MNRTSMHVAFNFVFLPLVIFFAILGIIYSLIIFYVIALIFAVLGIANAIYTLIKVKQLKEKLNKE